MTWIEKLLGVSSDETSTTDSVRPEIVAVQKALTSIDPDKAPYISCLALLAARLAGADLEISAGEKLRIAEVLQKQIHLSPAEAEAAADIASKLELTNRIEHYKVIELMNELATAEQKESIVRALFYVACDDDISEVESEKVREISKALNISNEQYIGIRLEFSKHRSILKSLPKR